jgi:hypothetical protein
MMMRNLFACVAAFVVGFGVIPASAQGTYVGAALTGDITRSTSSSSEGLPDFDQDGQALGFALRLGTSIGSFWGIEAEFSRPGEIEQDGRNVFPLAATTGVTWSSGDFDVLSRVYPSGGGYVGVTGSILPFGYNLETTERNSTFSTNLWARQAISDRASIVYLGGLAFTRSEYETRMSFSLPTVILPGLTSLIPPRSTETVVYSVRPNVGIEGRIRMSDHTELVPGIRLHGLQDGWLIRPSVGINWTF